MPRGGYRPGAGRKPKNGVTTKRVQKVMEADRERMLVKMFEDGEHPLDALRDLAKNATLERDRIAAATALARHLCPVPAQTEQLVRFRLPALDTPRAVLKAMDVLAKKVATGKLPSKQAEITNRILTQALEAFSQLDIAAELAAVKQRLDSMGEGDAGAGLPSYRVISEDDLTDIDPNPNPEEHNGHNGQRAS